MKKLFATLIVVIAVSYFSFTSLTWYRSHLENKIYNALALEASNVSQCRSVAVGHKACGGPDKYVVYSAPGTDAHTLSTLVKRHYQLDKFIESVTMSVSDCAYEQRPKPLLVEGQCTHPGPSVPNV